MVKYLKSLFVLMLWLPCTSLLGQDVGNPVLKQQVQKISFSEDVPLYIVNGKEVDEKKH